jgi:hypothetical protein
VAVFPRHERRFPRQPGRSEGNSAEGTIFHIFSLIAPNKLSPIFAPIRFKFDLPGRRARTPLKAACLRHCRSPLDFLLFHWRDGALGAVASGVGHGAFCLGCCWMLMALLFVGGVATAA